MNPMMLDFPNQFETERLLLRSPLPGDGAAVYEATLESLDDLRPWMAWSRAEQSLESVEENVRNAYAAFVRRERLRFLLFHRETGQFLGSSELHHIRWENRRFEIGYWIRSSSAGQGYVTEAVDGITWFADTHLQATRVEIRCDKRNERSRRVAGRCGFHLEAMLLSNGIDANGALFDDLVYTKIRLPDGTLGYPT